MSLNNMLDVYTQKYKANKIIALKSLSYFGEVNTNEPVNFIDKAQISWDKIKKWIIFQIQNPDSNL